MAGLAVDGLCRAREIVRKTRAQMRGEEGHIMRQSMLSDGAAHGKHPIMSVTALRPWRFLVSLRGPWAASRPIASRQR